MPLLLDRGILTLNPSILAQSMRRPTRTYGAKKAPVSSAAAAIFGSSTTNAAPGPATGRDALKDITEAINNIKLQEGKETEVEEEEREGEGEAVIKGKLII
ncbi:hypothetical protein BJ875DRAFT_198110 [Amylocarpus encephaloides]|uniref:Uncharacterized protein n=1 Tax=Amylocarpus encephaloides TaxID=45428 RepID=A0A9P8C0H2_9HELO|nr:hypothetical protein BJ875DRAFT_198110 [Amylocarpus encephaloides]